MGKKGTKPDPSEAIAFMKGAATAAAIALVGMRKPKREDFLAKLVRKATNRGITKAEMIGAIETAEDTAARPRKR